MAKRKNFGIKNFFFSLIAVCIVIYIFQSLHGSVETVVAVKGDLENIIKAEGIIVKDERIYNATLDGSVTYYYEEGSKVKQGQLIANLNTDSNSVQINKQIAEIEAAINSKKKNPEVAAVATKEALTLYEDDIQDSILKNEFDNMYNIVGQVDNNGAVFVNQGTYDSYDINQLENMKKDLEKSISTHKVPYYSAKAGIITYKIDGLEEVYNIEDVYNLTASSTLKKEYTVSDKFNKETVSANEGILKIIRNFDYYIAATVDNEKAKLFSENKYIKTRIHSDGQQYEVWGFIKKINYGSEQSVLILYFDDYFYKIYDERYVDLELITDIYEGIKINTESLTEKDGMTGVYVQDASNIIKFFPIEIIGMDENFTIVALGEYVEKDERRLINVDGKRYFTVKIFDKVISDPEMVYEGQIAD
ncbi:HlyD family efflux transporter periplasmic adaptor subunit [Sedimentibacter sp.]|uniref:HlyD family efflux transporter periplasmic adaptor subunit n=1 Tax=Sedimentibacter sp. TaxID=1960295 RepID=UPI0028A8CCC4|nr:HlyD family efflux transporter periplasmic adaptor subunit [Sedimentibacter sp.]